MKKYVTIKEAAEWMRVSYRTMQRYIAEGKLPCTKPGGRVLIKEIDLEKFANMGV